ncbi:hypothetical protein Tco_1042179 [Tanacetum coccineum]|uniref:Uncharacterized protein n=1 Tax=Tanacetum coccineum TaxID=301880 RepID=A0ABQ5GJT2_9ASTR
MGGARGRAYAIGGGILHAVVSSRMTQSLAQSAEKSVSSTNWFMSVGRICNDKTTKHNPYFMLGMVSPSCALVQLGILNSEGAEDFDTFDENATNNVTLPRACLMLALAGGIYFHLYCGKKKSIVSLDVLAILQG